MPTHHSPGKKELNKGAAAYSDLLLVKLKVQKEGTKGNKHPVPNQIYCRNGNKLTQYARKPPDKNSEVENEKIFIQFSRRGRGLTHNTIQL